jgi:hypothetical protein
MSALLRGLDEGLRTGVQLGGILRQGRQRRALAEEAGRYGVEEDPEISPEALQRAQIETMGRAERDAQEFGLETPQQFRVQGMQPREAGYRMGDQRFGTREEAEQAARIARSRGLSRVYSEFGDVDRSEQMLERADTAQTQQMQRQLLGMQVSERQRTATLNQTLDQIYADPDMSEGDRVQATLNAYARYNPVEAQQLRAQYSENELRDITLEGQRMQQGVQKALVRGVDSAIKWFDDQNDSFQLEREGNTVFQVNEDGSRSVFIRASNEQDLAMQLEQRATPGGMLELAKFNLDFRKAAAQEAYYNSKIQALQRDEGRASQQLLGAQTVMIRGEDGRMQQAITGMRFNRASGEMEAVTLPLDTIGVPMSALDQRRVQEVAERLVGKPIDPTNRSRKAPVHDEVTAQQAAVDSIINSYLGGGLSRDAGGESPEAIERIRQVAQEEQAGRTRTPAPPSPARQEQLRRQGISRITPQETVEAAAEAGNPRAIEELRRREADADRTAERTRVQARGLQ